MSDNHIDRIRHRLDAVGTLSKPRQIARADEDLTGLPVLTTEQRTADRESDDRKRYRVGPETCEQASMVKYRQPEAGQIIINSIISRAAVDTRISLSATSIHVPTTNSATRSPRLWPLFSISVKSIISMEL